MNPVDKPVHRIHLHYPADSVFVLSTLISWIVIYPVDCVIQPYCGYTYQADRRFMDGRDGKICCSDFPHLNKSSNFIYI